MRLTFYIEKDGDWIDLFIDGKKVYGGHSMTAYQLAKILSEHSLGVDVDPITTWEYKETDDFQLPVINGFTLGEAA